MLFRSKSQGLFIWASTLCNLIHRAPMPVAQLDSLLLNTSGQLVQGLDSLYAATLEISHSWIGGDAGLWEHFRRVMAIILFCGINVDDATVDLMLGLPESKSSRHIVSHFSALLQYEPGRPIRPLHASFRDYLTDGKRSGGRPWSLVSTDPEHLLAVGCFQIMSNQLCFNICGIRTSHKWDREYFNGSNTKEAISQELKYSCQYWGKHLKAAQTLDNRLVSLLETFSYQNFLFWFEVMRLSDLRHEARDMCKEIAKHVRVCNFGFIALISASISEYSTDL